MTEEVKAIVVVEKPEPPKPIGRPTIYTQELADAICEQLSEGKSLRTVCKAENMPSARSVFYWLRTYPEFLQQYTRAKEEAADALVDEMIEIADDGSNDYMLIVKGDQEYNVEDREVTNRSKLRVETRKWIASKLKPKKYGDKLDLTSGGRTIKPPAVVSIIEARNAAIKPQATDSHTGDK